jgi:hypothetical protein
MTKILNQYDKMNEIKYEVQKFERLQYKYLAHLLFNTLAC